MTAAAEWLPAEGNFSVVAKIYDAFGAYVEIIGGRPHTSLGEV